MFDENGVFALDTRLYIREVDSLVRILSEGGWGAWLTTRAELHVKLYSLSATAFGRWGGLNILIFEPLNVLYYLAILFLTYKLAKELFGNTVAIYTAVIVALWPSLLLHTTQLLKDPPYIALMLALILVVTRWITRSYSMKQGLITGVVGGAVIVMLLVLRADMWNVARFTVFLGICVAAFNAVLAIQIPKGNLLSIAAVLALTLNATQIVTSMERWAYGARGTPAEQQERPVRERIELFRSRSIKGSVTSGGTNIDADLKLETWTDVIMYLPRALEIGCLAPFPQMWLSAGRSLGLAGRLVSVFETPLMYTLEFLALVCLWHRRREPPVWLLLLTALAGMTALGLVVVNIGTLYRLRYFFLILVFILGVEGARQLWFLRLNCDHSTSSVERDNPI
jgi:hypothetical protein